LNLFELAVKIGVDDSEFNKGVGKAKKGFGDFSAWTIAKGQLIADAIKASGKAFLDLGKQAINSFAEYEQLAGGAQKIFDQIDYSKIASDANNAYKELGLSANQYLSVINDVGATFAATMGDEAGYEAAKTGLKAISDYASGTGKNVDELSQKFTLITRSTSSYQSIADQFSGILPATSAGFLEQAQAAGILSDKYTELTQVPIDEYQAAVSQMLQQGVAELGLANNTMNEAFSTLSGSLSMAKGAWSNLVTGLADDSADLDMLIGNFVESVGAAATNLIPKIGTALNGASKLVRDLIPVIVQEIPVLIEKNLPILAEAAISIIQSLVDGISENQEMLMTTAMETITFLATSLISMLPQIVQLGLDLIVSLANGIAESLPTLIPTIVDVILKIVETLTNPNMITKLLNASVVLIVALAKGLIAAVPQLIERIPVIIDNLVAGFSDFLQPVIEIGSNIVGGIKKGISEAWDNLVKWFKGLFGDLIGIAKKILGIASPSKVFKKLGAWTAEGFGIGFDDEFANVARNIEDSLDFGGYDYEVVYDGNSFDSPSANGVRGGGVTVIQNIYSEAKTAADLMQEALYQQERAVYLGV
jgi:hypothetical protein